MTPWLDAIQRFLDYSERQGRASATLSGYRAHLTRLAAAHPLGPSSVDEERFEAWAAEQSRGSARHAWYACRAFYAWAVASELVDSSPVGAWRGRAARSPYGYDVPRAWRSAVDEHLDRMHAKAMRNGSIRLHMSYLTRFARLHPNPWAVEPGDIARWLTLHSWKPETQRSALKSLRLFYRHAIQSGRTRTSPAAQLDRPWIPRSLPRPAAEPVIARALRDADVRTRLMILLAAFAGLRAGEVARVHLGRDLDGRVLLVHGKGGHERRVPVHPVLAEELHQEQERRRQGECASGFDPRRRLDPEGWLFPNGSGQPMTPGHVSKVVSRALPDGVTAHMLRHRFATRAYTGSHDVRAVQELLGHASVTTTQRYTSVANNALESAVLGVSAPSLALRADDDPLGREWARVAPAWARTALPSCPRWCTEHQVGDDGVLNHVRTLLDTEGLLVRIEAAGDDGAGLWISRHGGAIEFVDVTGEQLRELASGFAAIAGVAELLD